MKLSLLCIKQNPFQDHGDEVGVFPFLCFIFVVFFFTAIREIVLLVLYCIIFFILVINCYHLFSILLKWKNLNYPKPG